MNRWIRFVPGALGAVLGVGLLAFLVRPTPCGACTPTPFAETWELRLMARTVDGVPADSVPTADFAFAGVVSVDDLDRLWFYVNLRDGPTHPESSRLRVEVVR